MMPAMLEVKINMNCKKKHYTGLEEESFMCLIVINIRTDMEPCCTAGSFSFFHTSWCVSA
jgi:hypothetical protein